MSKDNSKNLEATVNKLADYTVLISKYGSVSNEQIVDNLFKNKEALKEENLDDIDILRAICNNGLNYEKDGKTYFNGLTTALFKSVKNAIYFTEDEGTTLPTIEEVVVYEYGKLFSTPENDSEGYKMLFTGEGSKLYDRLVSYNLSIEEIGKFSDIIDESVFQKDNSRISEFESTISTIKRVKPEIDKKATMTKLSDSKKKLLEAKKDIISTKKAEITDLTVESNKKMVA